MGAPTSTYRSVAVGLLLAAIAAGSLIAFSLLAGEADLPLRARVGAASNPAAVPPVVVAGPPDENADVRPDRNRRAEPVVLGITVAQNSATDTTRRDGDGRRDANDPTKDSSPDRDTDPCCLDDAKKKGGNGRAYGHDGSKGDQGRKGKTAGHPSAAKSKATRSPSKKSGGSSNGGGHSPGKSGGTRSK